MKKNTGTSPLLWLGLLAIGPLTIGFVYFAHAHDWTLIERGPAEITAPIILSIAAMVFAFKAVLQRNPVALLLGCFAVIAWLREWHFDWVHHGVYVLLAILGGWIWLWRKRLRPFADAGSFLPWFKATMVIYVLAVLLARRAFRDVLPYEDVVNTQLEETMENVAHLMLLITSFVISKLPPLPALAQRQTERNAPTVEG